MTSLTDYMVPTTALQAVNVILEAIGQRPVASLTNPGTDAQTALKRLGESNVETQAEGWSFNTNESFQIDPGLDGSLTLPSGTLRVRQMEYDAVTPSAGAPTNPPPGTKVGKRLVIRGNRLYDRVGNTFNICGVAGPGVTQLPGVSVDLTICLEYEMLPQAARWYIAVKAARRMTAGVLVSGTAYQFTKADEDMARLRMEQEEDDAEHLDQMAGNPHIQNMRRR